MKYLKKFESYTDDLVLTSPKESPSTPKRDTEVAPGTRPGRTSTSPIRRNKPQVAPNPLAKLKKATEDDVINRYEDLARKK